MNFTTNNGIYKYDFELSQLEKQLIREFEDKLDNLGFKYLKIPSTITNQSFERQEIDTTTLSIDDLHVLAGSAEQGILEYFSDSIVQPQMIYSTNTCFRDEENYDGLKYFKEFTKIEMFAFIKPDDYNTVMAYFMNIIESFFKKWDIKYRLVKKTDEDPGYHKEKYDYEIFHKETHDWIETHSLTYFGDEQIERFNIKGDVHTISCTGLAFPRILLPFIEKIN